MWDALKAVTVNGAYQYFEENEKGTVTPGEKGGFCGAGTESSGNRGR